MNATEQHLKKLRLDFVVEMFKVNLQLCVFPRFVVFFMAGINTIPVSKASFVIIDKCLTKTFS